MSLLKNSQQGEKIAISRVGLFPWFGHQINRLVEALAANFVHFIAFLFGPKKQNDDAEHDRNGLYLWSTLASIALSIGLAAVSFLGSFDAASKFAVANGVSEQVAPFVPVSVDGFIVLSIIVIFASSMGGYSAKWIRLALLIATGVSIFFNVAHVAESNRDLTHVLLGAVFPVIVFMATEISAFQIKAYVVRRSLIKTVSNLFAHSVELANERDQLENKVSILRRDKAILEETSQQLTEQIEDYTTTFEDIKAKIALVVLASGENQDSTVIQRRVKLIQTKVNKPNMSTRALAKALDVSERTIYDDVKSLNGALSHD